MSVEKVMAASVIAADPELYENVAAAETPTSDEIISFLELARPEGLVSLTSIIPDGTTSTKTFDMPGEVEDAAEWASMENQTGKNLYWMPSVPKRWLNKKATKADIESMPYGWVDLDPTAATIKAEGYKVARDQVCDSLSKYPDPTFIIDSGNGIQPFYRLTEPMTDQDRFEAANKALHGAAGDSTYNCDRIMRLPGTLNYPNKAKLKKGYLPDPRRASIYHEGGKNMPTEHFIKFADAPPISSKMPEQNTPVFTPLNKAQEDGLKERIKQEAQNERFAARLAGKTDGLNDTSRSGLDMSLGSMLKIRGYSYSEMVRILTKHANGAGSEKLEAGDMRYFERIWERSVAGEGVIVLDTLEEAPEYTPDEDRKLPDDLLHPPGRLGELIKLARSWDGIDQPVLALGIGISTLSMLSGNNFVVQRNNDDRVTPLGVYSVLVAPTGKGKNTGRDFPHEMNRLAGGIALTLADIASDAALRTALDQKMPVHYTRDEFGLWLIHARSREGSHTAGVMKEVISVYGQGTGHLDAKVYASGKEFREAISNPYLTMSGLTTPEMLGRAISSGDVDSGALNRFLIFEGTHKKTRIPAQRNVDTKLSDWLKELGKIREQINSQSVVGSTMFPDATDKKESQVVVERGGREFISIKTSSAAEEVFKSLERNEDRLTAGSSEYGPLYARLHMHGIILAGLAAIGDSDNLYCPVITENHAVWGARLAEYCLSSWKTLFEDYHTQSAFDADVKLVLKAVRNVRNMMNDDRDGEIARKGYITARLLTRGPARGLRKDQRENALVHLITQGKVEKVQLPDALVGTRHQNHAWRLKK
ncbi:hypothetical protein N9100_00935 [Gammaproteobacteria bacterium]|nr:hypothetical protein [Gammaproteobacteria bacterium]